MRTLPFNFAFHIPHSAFRIPDAWRPPVTQTVDLLAIAPHRPFKVLYALAYREDPVKPSFVVDISDTFETKLEAIRCYASQFDGARAAGEIHPTGQDLYEL